MQLPLADRIERIEPFHVMELLTRAQQLEREGRDIVHLEVGEPDFPTPDKIINAGQQALAKGYTRYTPSLGIPELREKISEYYQQTFDLSIPAKRIAITPGGSGGLLLALAASLNPGQGLLLPEPGYPCNRHFAELLNITPQAVNTRPDQGYRIRPQDLQTALTEHSAGVLLASPSNPTGSILDQQEIKQVTAFCQQHRLHWFMDEIYQGLTFAPAQQETVLSHYPHAWVIQSFSKYFQMTGWRLGWLVIPEGFENAVEKLAQNIFLSPPTPAQYAALSAFDLDVIELLEQRRLELQKRRDFLLPKLMGLGFKIHAQPQGAFYIYCDASALTTDAMQFCHRLLNEAGVAITPGEDFGGADKQTCIRIAYTQPIERLQLAINRMAIFLNNEPSA